MNVKIMSLIYWVPANIDTSWMKVPMPGWSGPHKPLWALNKTLCIISSPTDNVRKWNRNLPHRQDQHHRAQWQPLCWSPPNHLNPQCPRLPSHRGPISSRIHFSPNLVCAATCFCEIWDLLLWASKALACKSLPGVHSVQFRHQLITVSIKISCQAKNCKFEVETFWLAQTFRLLEPVLTFKLQ